MTRDEYYERLWETLWQTDDEELRRTVADWRFRVPKKIHESALTGHSEWNPFGSIPVNQAVFAAALDRVSSFDKGGHGLDRADVQSASDEWQPTLLSFHQSHARKTEKANKRLTRRARPKGPYRRIFATSSGARYLVEEVSTNPERVRVFPLSDAFEYDWEGKHSVLPDVACEEVQGDLEKRLPVILATVSQRSYAATRVVSPAARTWPPDVYAPIIERLYKLIVRDIHEVPDEVRAPKDTWTTIRLLLSAYDPLCFDLNADTVRSIHKRCHGRE